MIAETIARRNGILTGERPFPPVSETSWPLARKPPAKARKGRMSPLLPHVCNPIFTVCSF
jgi:hypothetical protein